jgi:hypothetical protein
MSESRSVKIRGRAVGLRRARLVLLVVHVAEVILKALERSRT